jgi:hypothetical protein
MKLTIYTAVNQDYFEFAKIFFYSLSENFPKEKIKKIIVNDLGLTESQRVKLTEISNSTIVFIKTTNETIITESQVHTKNWRKAVGQKTLGLHKICIEKNYPILMLDCDMYILGDFSDKISHDCDIQICKRPAITNREGYVLNYIACWFLIHNNQGKEFVESWINTMPYIKSGHKETPALCLLLSKRANFYRIKENHANDVASLDYKTNPRIIHFKSRPLDKGYTQSTMERILNIKHTPEQIKGKIQRFLN